MFSFLWTDCFIPFFKYILHFTENSFRNYKRGIWITTETILMHQSLMHDWTVPVEEKLEILPKMRVNPVNNYSILVSEFSLYKKLKSVQYRHTGLCCGSIYCSALKSVWENDWRAWCPEWKCCCTHSVHSAPICVSFKRSFSHLTHSDVWLIDASWDELS